MKGNKVVQFKIKPLSSWRTLWEETAYLGMLRLDTQEEADRVAEALSDIFVVEVRWNWLDSTQGHYVTSDYTVDAYFKERKMKEQNENLVD
jgi:hypothetical protein